MSTETVHLALYDDLADWEAAHAVAALNSGFAHREPGRFRVRTVGATLEPVTTAGGVRMLPDELLADLAPADSAMLILPGAGTWAEGNDAFGGKAREFLAAGVPVAAICGATAGLARAGLLDDRDHTSSAPQFLDGTGYAGADRYRDLPAVTDGDLITASPVAPVEFAREILTRLDVFDAGALDAWYRLYGRQEASAFFELAAADAR
ncbi:DJ-1/PfpI family protein [Phytomonospora sp. NPDC050363]|uniref:DJ-1/PfpI family protein n=1 Tax=Phytomonospora sp. NPDC050363 TaxID=3155642 RepID=UPI0033E555D1